MHNEEAKSVRGQGNAELWGTAREMQRETEPENRRKGDKVREKEQSLSSCEQRE